MVPDKIDAYYLPNPETMIMNVYAYIDTVNMELLFSSLPSCFFYWSLESYL